MAITRRELIKTGAIGGGGLVVGGVLGKAAGGSENGAGGGPSVSGLSDNAMNIVKERGLKPEQITAALKTYVPPGTLDTHYMFASGGHNGQVWVYGVPSMRPLKVIPVFGHSSYQGWGYNDESKAILQEGAVNGTPTSWGDTHHPSISETDGKYDGQYLFIGDKAHARMAVIDLRDFATKQIVKNPHMISQHGGSFCTPNTEYLIEPSQYAAPLGWAYAPLSKFKEEYRGVVTFWKFDRKKGRIDMDRSFSIEVPPYFQDLADAGKGVSDGWAFVNSFNTEMATGGTLQGKPPMEQGASQRDMDYMHVINWRKAAELVGAGKAETVNGMKILRIKTAAENGVLFLIPEPKSPHGVDVSPTGEWIVVSGKLDPHVTIFSFEKIIAATKKGGFRKDGYGIPIIAYDDAMEAQVEVGLGPLHTQFDNQGYAYTSLFLANGVARWQMGEAGRKETWKLLETVPTQFNVGHICANTGDTMDPQGKYLVALNKWSLNLFASSGPHHTPNIQLIDISQPKGMQVIYDAPCPDGEPHYAQMCPVDLIKPWTVYPEVGWDAVAQSKAPAAIVTVKGKERIVRNGTEVDVYMTAVRSTVTPDEITVRKGDTVRFHITNIERTRNASHGFVLPGYDISTVLDPGQTQTITIKADSQGTFPFYCPEFCSALHLEMMGYFLVQG